jgi:glycosyltransferase involved in cell wall biosynthesis
MTSNNTKPRILICIPCLGLGGAEDIIVRLANGLASSNQVALRTLIRCDEDRSRVAALSPAVDFAALVGGPRSQNSLGFKLWNTCFYLFAPLLAVYLYFLYAVRSRDTVHVNLTQFAHISIFWRLLSVGRRPMFVQTFHTNMHLLRKWQRTIFSTSWKFMDKVVVEIDASEVAKVRRFVPDERITFIPFAVALDEHGRDLGQHDADKLLTFGSLARLRLFEKKYDEILWGLAILKQQNVRFRYLIGGDGPDREKIAELVASLGLVDYVEMLGAIEDRAAFFSQIDLMIVATVGEDTGIAGLQALAAGVPLLGFNTKTAFVPAPGRKLLLASSSAELSGKLLEAAQRDLRAYWNELCQERRDQIGDTEMIRSYSRLFVGNTPWTPAAAASPKQEN